MEDRLSETVLRILLSQARGRPVVAQSYPISKGWQKGIGPNGYGYIKKSLHSFNATAAIIPFVVLADADNRPCPPETIASWLGNHPQHPQLIVRIAVREVEAWLLADRSGMANYLGVHESWIPTDTARIKDPKRYISRLAARSRRKEIREELARAPGTRSKTGPYFNQSLQYFVKELWNIPEALKHSDSLRRATKSFDAL